MAKIKRSKELTAKLVKLRNATAAEVRKGVAKGAELIVGEQRRLVPIDEGDLRVSIDWIFQAQAANQTKAIIFAGGAKAPYAPYVEFGTSSAPAQPFFFPGYRVMRRRAKAAIAAEVRRAIKAIGRGA